METNRLDHIDKLLDECRDKQEERRVLKAALLYCNDHKERNKLEMWLMVVQHPPKNRKKKQPGPGNPNFKKEYTIESQLAKHEVLDKAFDLLEKDYERYKPQRKGAVVSNELKGEIADQLDISESKAYRTLKQFSRVLLLYYREQESK